MIVKVDRKTARESYVAGGTITVFDETVDEDYREIIEFSCSSNIKPESKVRRFNRIVKTFTDYVGVPSFWLEKID